MLLKLSQSFLNNINLNKQYSNYVFVDNDKYIELCYGIYIFAVNAEDDLFPNFQIVTINNKFQYANRKEYLFKIYISKKYGYSRIWKRIYYLCG